MFIGNILTRAHRLGSEGFIRHARTEIKHEKTLFMDEFVSKGQRCRATRNNIAHQGLVRAQTEGTNEFETDNLGRRLVKSPLGCQLLDVLVSG